MTTTKIIEIKRRRGVRLTIEWIRQFEKEWSIAISSIKRSGADLSKIILVEKTIRGQIKELKNG